MKLLQSAEIEIKKSRFIAYYYELTTKEEAKRPFKQEQELKEKSCIYVVENGNFKKEE